MRIAFALLVAVHGAIHLMGFVKAFGFANLSQLHQPISRPLGALWLIAAALLIASAALLMADSPLWWVAAAPAVVLSQIAIVSSWSDAKIGTVANVILLVPLCVSLLDLRGGSYRSEYHREVERGLARRADARPVTEAEIAALPPLLQTYLRRARVVGRPHVQSFRARMHGEIRNGPSGGWMPFRADQTNFYDEPSRLFYMRAALHGIPFDALHRYVGPSATMQVRVASIVPMVDARGPEMNRSETVTMFNDMCVFAPASLVGANVEWEQTGERNLRGTFTNAGHTISADLTFDASGDLVGWVSRDRLQSADGKTYKSYPWSTPLHDYKDFGGARVASRAEAIWLEPEGEFVYGRFELDEIVYNEEER